MKIQLALAAALFAAVAFCKTGEADLDVRQFGAKGDGVTDDSAAFTAAGNELWKRAKPMARPWGHLNREKASGSIEGPRPRIVVPKGKYLLKETACLHSDIILVGEDGAELIGPDPTKDVLYLHGCYRVRLENLTFRGGRHSVFAETFNKESANFRITNCRFYESAEIAFLSPSYKVGKRPVGAWTYDEKTGAYAPNPKHWTEPKRHNNHSSMVVIDNCRFENCEGCVSMCPDGSVVRNSTFLLPQGSTNSAFLCGNLMHAYGLKIVHSSGGAAFRSLGNMRMWMEDSSVTTSDGSGARVLEGSYFNDAQVSDLVLSDIETDAGLRSDNAICSFAGHFPAIAALVRVTATGPHKVRGFTFGPVADEAAFVASMRVQLWEPDRVYSYGIRDCGANILPIEEGCYAKRFERLVPDWAAAPGGTKCHFEAPKLENARKSVFPGTWQIRTTPWEIAEDTVIDARGVAAFAGMSSDRPWFVVKKGAKLVIRNIQVRGGKSFVVVEDGGEAYVDTCFSYDAEGATFVCQKGGRLVVDNGVYYAPRIYEGEGDSFIRSVWYRFTEVVPYDQELNGGAAVVNRGRLVIWDLLGVPTVFGRFDKDFAQADPVKRYDLRWIDNFGDYRSRMMRYGGEWGGLTPAWHHGAAKTLIEGSYDWYWNRSVPDTPVVVCAAADAQERVPPVADVKMFAVNICLYRQFLKYIGLLYRDKDGKDVPCDSSGLAFTCPTAEVTNRLQTEIDRVSAAGGGVVDVPSGRTTMAGVLTLRSNVTLKLRDDSEIYFPDDPSLYGRAPALVYAEGATNVAIVGTGVIRAKGERWHGEIYAAKGWRPRFFQFRRCAGVRLEDFRVRGSPMWTIHLLMSQDIVVRGLDVFARGHNTDGIDVDSSQDVLIENCRLDQGDDGFVMKSGKNEEGRRRAMPTRNVTIRNCTVVNGHTLLGIGSELSGGIEDVHLESCKVEGEVWKVLYVKSSRARGGWARNISVRNVTCERAKVCVFGIRTDYGDVSYSPESTDTSFLTPMENIVMENVTVDHGWRVTEIDGFKEKPPKGVVLRNVTLKHPQRGVHDIRNGGDLRLEGVQADPGSFSVWCDEPDAKYACGDTAVFTVAAHTNAGVAHVRLDNFGNGVICTQSVDFATTPSLTVKGGRDIPGFLKLTVTLGKETKRCGASFCRQRIASGCEKPADFESFWREAIAKYDREVPVDVKLERSETLSTNGCDVFRVKLSDPFGRTVGGYLKEPRDVSKGPFHVLVNIPGAGPCVGTPTWQGASLVELMMNVHYWPAVDGAAKRGPEHTALQEKEDAAWLKKYPVASNRRYCVCGIAASREDYYYYGAILAINRAVNWLRTRPEVRADDFRYFGGSQGGGMGLALMALNGHFRRGFVLVPALTAHHCHKIDGRQEGWPNLLLSQLPENEAAASRNAPYFDGVNFASMIQNPILFSASYTDTVAPPHAAYAAYNACPAKEKFIMDVVGFGHEGSRVESGEAKRWLMNEDHDYVIPIANMTAPRSPWK